MIVRSRGELEMLREGGRRLGAALRELVRSVRPGVSTEELDRIAEELIRSSGGIPAFKGYRAEAGTRPFPASLCASVNDEVVHAPPRRDRILREGDIIGLDFGMRYPAAGGLITDTSATVPVGRVAARAEELIGLRAGRSMRR